MIDDIDREILKLLQDNARISNAEIARQVGLAPSAVLKRVRRMEDEKIILAYETRVDHHKVGLDISTFVLISTGEKPGSMEIGKKIAALPEVQEVHFSSGDYYYFARAKTRNTREYNEFVRKLGDIGVKDCRSTLILDTLKESLKLKL